MTDTKAKAVSFRLPPDVAESIATEAKRLGVSQAKYVSNLVRLGDTLKMASDKAAGLPVTEAASVIGTEFIDEVMAHQPPAGPLTGVAEKCLHPVNRRIGKGCGVCGEAVK